MCVWNLAAVTGPPWHWPKIKTTAHCFFSFMFYLLPSHPQHLLFQPWLVAVAAPLSCQWRAAQQCFVLVQMLIHISAWWHVASLPLCTYFNNVFLVPGSGRPTTKPRRTVSWTCLVLKRTMPSRTAALAALASMTASLTLAPVTRSNTLALTT